MPLSIVAVVVGALTVSSLVSCGRSPTTAPTSPPAQAPSSPGGARVGGLPRPDHVVVVVLENHAFAQIDGSPTAAYLDGLMTDSAVFTRSRAVTHPSQPNYLALFSGSTHGVTDNRCPVRIAGPANLGSQLLGAGLTFAGFAEGMPRAGFTGCVWGRYARKHNPWVDFTDLPDRVNQPGGAFGPDFAALPTVSFLVPDMCNGMHDCPIRTSDAWLRMHIDGYVRWARDHNSLLVLTFDEDDNRADNHILTLVAGAGVRPGRYPQPITHYDVLATIEDMYGLPRLGNAGEATAIRDVWR